MPLHYFLGSMANFISKKLQLYVYHGVSGLSFVWILRHFSGDICFLFTCPLPHQILLGKAFPKEPSIWFAVLLACLRIISPRPGYSEQACSIASGLLLSFVDKFARGLDRASEMSVVITFDICNVYEIFAYNWLYY